MTASGAAYPGNCAECGYPLVGYEIKHGWVTVQASWRVYARVHAVCKAAFERRPYEEQKARAIR